MGEIVSIPIAGGIDRSVAKVIGSPRVDRLERARFVQSGQVVRSPGYANDMRLPAVGGLGATKSFRGIGYHQMFGAWAALFGINVNNEFWGFLYRQCPEKIVWQAPPMTQLTQYRVSPAEAVRRLAAGAQAGAISDTQIISTTDPSLALVMCGNGTVGRIRNGRIDYSTLEDFGERQYAAGRCFLIVVGDDTSTYVVTYDKASDSFTRAIAIGDDSTIGVLAASAEFGQAGMTTWCAALQSDFSIIVVKSTSGTFSIVGTIPASDLPAGAMTPTGCVAFSSLVVAVQTTPPSNTSLYFRAYDLLTLAAGVRQHPPLPSTVGTTNLWWYFPRLVEMCGDPSGNGNIWFACTASRVNPKSTEDVTVVGTFVLSGNTVGPFYFSFVLPSRVPIGRFIPGPLSASGVILPVKNYDVRAYGSLNAGVEFWGISNFAAPTLLTSCAFGEADTSSNQYVSSYSVCVAAEDEETGMQTEEVLVPFASVNQKKQFEVIRLRVGRRFEGNTLNAIPYSGGGSVNTINPVNALQQSGEVVTGGVPFRLGVDIDLAGFWFDPPTPDIRVATTGGVSDVGTYLFCFVMVYVDSTGNIIRSAPSTPANVVVANATTRVVTVTNANDPFPAVTGLALNNFSVEFYQTSADGSIFYLQGTNTFALKASADGSGADGGVQTNSRILYTQGSSGALSGQKPNYTIPPCRCIWRGRDRYIAGGLEQPNRVRFSKLIFPGEGINFPHPGELGWVSEITESVTAVAQLDDAWIVASQTEIYAIYGQGPDDTGKNGSFDYPRKISHNIGIHSWRSLCELPEGLLFQSQDGQIHLILRGTLQIIWFSEHIRDELTDLDTGIAKSWIANVVQHETRNTIHFVRRSGPIIVYDKRVQSWSFDHDDGKSPGLNGAISACAIRMPPTVGKYAGHETESYPSVAMLSDVVASAQYIVYEACADGNTFGSPFGMILALPDHGWNALLETNDIALWGLAGWGATNRFNVLLSGDGTNLNGLVTFSFWNRRGGSAVEKRDVPYVLPDSDAYCVSQFEPNNRKGSSFRVRLEWGAENIVGLSVETDAKPLSERTAAGVRT
jgi:hypothetical protein